MTKIIVDGFEYPDSYGLEVKERKPSVEFISEFVNRVNILPPKVFDVWVTKEDDEGVFQRFAKIQSGVVVEVVQEEKDKAMKLRLVT